MQRDFITYIYLQTFMSTMENKIKVKTGSQKCGHFPPVLFARIALMKQTIKRSFKTKQKNK